MKKFLNEFLRIKMPVNISLAKNTKNIKFVLQEYEKNTIKNLQMVLEYANNIENMLKNAENKITIIENKLLESENRYNELNKKIINIQIQMYENRSQE